MAIISEVQQQDVPLETQSIDAQSTEENADEGDFKPFAGHTETINQVVYSPDGKFLATGSDDSTVRTWDVTSGRQVGITMRGHTRAVYNVCYAPDGKSLVSGSTDGTVRIWDTTDVRNTPVQTIEHSDCGIWSVKCSPDGRLIASGGSDGKLKIWDARKKAFKSEYGEHSGWIHSVAWEPSGKRLATGCRDGKVRVFDLAKPDVAVLVIEGHRDEVNSVMYSPDGMLLASGADDWSVRLWNVQTGKAVKSPFRGHKDWVMSVVWSPDSTRIISSSWDNTVRVWDVGGGRTLFDGALYAHSHHIWNVTYSPDGKSFASADEGKPPRVQIWNAKTGEPSLPLLTNKERSDLKKSAEKYFPDDILSKPEKMQAGAAVLAIVWFPDGQRFASAGEESLVRIWSAQTGLQTGELETHHQTVNALSVSADGTKIAVASNDRAILLFDTRSMQSLTEPLTGHDEAVYAVKLTDDGTRVISGSKDKAVRFWDALTGRTQHVIKAHTDAVRALSVAKDGSKLASGGDDGCIYVWDMRNYKRLAGTFKHEGSVRALSFSPDGSRLISGSDDFTARVWNVATGNLAFDPIRVHTGPISAVDWSPDGTKLMTTGAHDWTIWVWEAPAGANITGPLEPVRSRPNVRTNGIGAAAFYPDGTRFVGGFIDHRLRIWDTASGKVVIASEDETDREPESNTDGSDGKLDEPQTKAEGSKRERARHHNTDDSIDIMPAAFRKEPASTSRGFWDGAYFDHPPRRQGKSNKSTKNKKNVDESQHKGNMMKQLWQRRSFRTASKLKGKNKASTPESSGPEQHAMTRLPRPPPMDVSAAHDKLRVVAAGYDPRQRFRGDQIEPESDEDTESPIGSTDPNRPGSSSSRDDESEHGIVHTICFCLCLPCCK